MNENVKMAIGFIVGLLTGGAVMYFVQEKKLSREFENELEDYKAQFEKEHGMNDETDGENDPEDKEENDKSIEEDKDTMSKKDIPDAAIRAVEKMQEGIRNARNKRERQVVNYSRSSKDVKRNFELDPKDEQYFDENYNPNHGPDNNETYENLSAMLVANRPRMMTPTEFDKFTHPDYEYLTLHRDYVGNVYDDDGNLVEDVDNLVGYDNLVPLENNECAEVYIRNDNMHLIIDVINEDA